MIKTNVPQMNTDMRSHEVCGVKVKSYEVSEQRKFQLFNLSLVVERVSVGICGS